MTESSELKLFLVKQNLPDRAVDYRRVLSDELRRLDPELVAGRSIAVAAGSRGIANIADITRMVVDDLRNKGGTPFIFPAMGSHGGATAEGQVQILASHGITPESMGCEVRSSMEVVRIDTDLDVPVYVDRHAWHADGIILVNRIKPHTDFHDSYESGLVKMCAIGAGKQEQAKAIHELGQYGLKQLLPQITGRILKTGKVLAGVGIVEDALDQTMMVRVLMADEIMDAEPAMLDAAKANMPSLPVSELDVLIVDRIGKNISGVGMDPNIIGRIKISGIEETGEILIKRIMVDDVTDASFGNALGIGLADVITRKLFDRIDFEAMYQNVYTSTLYERAKIPIIARNAADAYQYALRGCHGLTAGSERIIRIRDTMSLGEVFVSQPVLDEIRDDVELVGGPFNQFDKTGNLIR